MMTSLLIKTVAWPVIKDSRVIVACFTREARVNLLAVKIDRQRNRL